MAILQRRHAVTKKANSFAPCNTILLTFLFGILLLAGTQMCWLFNTNSSLEFVVSKSSDPSEGPPPIAPHSSAASTKKSLHPKWKLWQEMNEREQEEALDHVGDYLRKYGKLIMTPAEGDRQIQSSKRGSCEFQMFGGQTGHALCLPKPEKKCTFFSFGINDDPSFDIELATKWNCRGFAGDPTVEHNSKLHPLVTFHNFGATTLSDNEEREINKGGGEEWWETSMPGLRLFLGLDRVDIIKMDCEGCEVALARDIILEDPDFLKQVGQISIETHVTKTWIKTKEHIYYFGLHFALLEEAGFQLEWSSVFGCSKRHEITGCVPELEKYGFPCGYKPWPGHPTVVRGRSCHDFLWKQYPTAHEDVNDGAKLRS